MTAMGLAFRASAVVLTTGTFLGGRIRVGLGSYQGGRAGDPPANALAEKLRALPFRVGRLKTGTPPRLDGRTIDYARLDVQPGDDPPPAFSFDPPGLAERPRQVCCHIARTNERTHDVIRGGLDRSPMYSGVIEGTGPRYCPSVEDKVVRFADKASHQIFVEPEGLDTTEVYPNGISTSLPFDVQHDLVRSIEGFESAVITRPGYAIEYDYFDPRDLRPTLETSAVAGLFFAGQLNGTTGYEEAAAQGLVAGPQRGAAGRRTRAVDPPARRGLRRGPHRRPDLARDERAVPHVHEPGRVSAPPPGGQRGASSHRGRAGARESWTTSGTRCSPRGARPWSANGRGSRGCAFAPGRVPEGFADEVLGRPLGREQTAWQLLRRPEVRYADLMRIAGPGIDDRKVAAQLEIEAKYAGYVERQDDEVARTRAREALRIPDGFDYRAVRGLSAEVSEKLALHRPATIGQAGRVSGVTPAAVSLLLVHLKRHGAWPAEERVAAQGQGD